MENEIARIQGGNALQEQRIRRAVEVKQRIAAGVIGVGQDVCQSRRIDGRERLQIDFVGTGLEAVCDDVLIGARREHEGVLIARREKDVLVRCPLQGDRTGSGHVENKVHRIVRPRSIGHG